MAKKNALIHYPVLNTGGAEKSTIKLANKLAGNGWNIDLVITTKSGDLKLDLHKNINLYFLRNSMKGDKFKHAVGLNKIRYLVDGFGYLHNYIFGLIRSITFLNRSYEFAMISLQGLSPHFCTTFVRANKRFHWLRSDLRKCDPEKRIFRNIVKYEKWIDYYLCVAESVNESFCELHPDLSNKSVTIYNILEADKMLQLAHDSDNPYLNYEIGNCTKVVTVCRLDDNSKGLIRMVEAFRILVDQGYKFKWFIVGAGKDYQLLAQAIKDFGLESDMIMVGLKSNPYPYFIHADLSASLSYFEGFCGAVNEAKILGTAVLATEFSGIHEQIIPGKNGIIVKNTLEGIISGFKSYFDSAELRKRIKNNYLPVSISDDEEKIRSLISLINR